MGSIGERIGSGGSFSGILWCDLTRDVSNYSVSFYYGGSFFTADDVDISSKFIDTLRRGEWIDCFGNVSRKTKQGFIIFEHEKYRIEIELGGGNACPYFDVKLFVDGNMMVSHYVSCTVESQHYSVLYGKLIDREGESKKMEKEKEELTGRLKSWAKENGYRFTEHADSVIESLLKQKKKHGKTYCPCRASKVDENICPCVHVHDDVKRKGHCLCLLFETMPAA